MNSDPTHSVIYYFSQSIEMKFFEIYRLNCHTEASYDRRSYAFPRKELGKIYNWMWLQEEHLHCPIRVHHPSCSKRSIVTKWKRKRRKRKMILIQNSFDRANSTYYGDSLFFTQADYHWYFSLPPIRFQGFCSACVPIGVSSCISAYVAIIYGIRMWLSCQQLVDCASPNKKNPKYDRVGCKMESIKDCLRFAMVNGLVLEKQYRYLERYGNCRNVPGKRVRIRNGDKLHNGSCVCTAIRKGPLISVIIVTKELCKYQYTDQEPKIYDEAGLEPIVKDDKIQEHCVVVVGYGVDKLTGEEYYIIMNCWGEEWGFHGFGLVKRSCLSEFYYPKGVHF